MFQGGTLAKGWDRSSLVVVDAPQIPRVELLGYLDLAAERRNAYLKGLHAAAVGASASLVVPLERAQAGGGWALAQVHPACSSANRDGPQDEP